MVANARRVSHLMVVAAATLTRLMARLVLTRVRMRMKRNMRMKKARKKTLSLLLPKKLDLS